MMQVKTFLKFLKNPNYSEDPEQSLSYRIRMSSLLLAWAMAISICLALLIGIVDSLGPWNLEEHAFDALLEEFSTYSILLLACLVAPILEELIFRAPMWFFRSSRNFLRIFYGMTLAFALVHLWNYPNLNEIWLLAPILISPQISLGLFLGFVRVRFGLIWCIAFHASYNFILLAPLLLLHEFGIPVL